jgi:CxxC motif-containing protein
VTEVGKYNIQRGKKFSIEDLLPPKQTAPSTTEGKPVKKELQMLENLKKIKELTISYMLSDSVI